MDSRDRPTVSAVVITYNEERNIRRCLESITWVDEIILVDSESRDKTVEIAKEFTNNIFIHPWSGFPPQRNFGISKAKGTWILILDADERVTLDAKKEITNWVISSEIMEYSAAQVPRKNFFFGRWLKFGGTYPDLQWRLFRNGKVCYDEKTLDTPLIEGNYKVLSKPFEHFTGERISDRIRKIYRETDYKAKELLKFRKRVYWFDILFRPMAAFMKIYLIKQGFRDGIQGYLYSSLFSFYTFVRYVKLWELTRE